jgi:diguanylate cyclase (GGDEF)-like protein
MTAFGFLSTQHQPSLVAASFLIATLASFVTLDLARRVRTDDALLSRVWWLGGSVAMGTGIWAMHFVAMLGFDAGIALGYREAPTLVSWLAAVGAALVALGVASRDRLGPGTLAAGSAAMALGISAMHYIGMLALDMAPGLVWNPTVVAASIVVALAASATALALFFQLRRYHGRERLLRQSGAALLMALAICGMHYTGMAAASFPAGAVCLSADRLGGSSLSLAVALATSMMLGLALLGSLHDTRVQHREARLARSLRASNEQLQAVNARLQALAYHDALTGLPNRLVFEAQLQRATATGTGNSSPDTSAVTLAVLFIDLDGFKPVNDTFGHAGGDQVLQEVAIRLRQLVDAPGTTMARIGGDEFVVLVECPQADTAARDLAERLLPSLGRPYLIDAQPVTLSCSVGIALHPAHGRGDRLLARADAAMYAAKHQGGCGWAVFEPHMDPQTHEQMALQQDLRHAIARGELSLHYQPKVSVAHADVQAVEALLRWQHPVRGAVGPARFVPVAERFGLIGMIGNWVIDEACAQLARWNALGWRCQMAINLSAHQLRQADLGPRIHDALQRHGLDPAQLVCEITESSLVENLVDGRRRLNALVDLGVKISLDDFGTGYSSLAYLRRLPVRELKIDRSLVSDVTTSHEARAIVSAVVQLAHALGMAVVAEGVETAAQRDVLVDLQCDLIQGYLYARPMPARALWDWMAAREAGARSDCPLSV